MRIIKTKHYKYYSKEHGRYLKAHEVQYLARTQPNFKVIGGNKMVPKVPKVRRVSINSQNKLWDCYLHRYISKLDLISLYRRNIKLYIYDSSTRKDKTNEYLQSLL